MYKEGTAGTLYPNWTTAIPGELVPIVTLGDSAYPLLNWFMKLFSHKEALTNRQKFNYHLSMARVVSENSVAWLKGQWECLSKRIDMAPERIPVLIIPCCILHNMCDIHGDEFDSNWFVENATVFDDDEPRPTSTTAQALPSATNTRDALVKYFEQL